MSIVLPNLAKFGLLMLQADDVSARFLLYLPATLSVILAKVCQSLRDIFRYIFSGFKREYLRQGKLSMVMPQCNVHAYSCLISVEGIIISNQLILALLLGCLCQLSCGWISTSSTSTPKPLRNNCSHHRINGVVSFISLRRPTSIIRERQSIAQNVRECTRIQKQSTDHDANVLHGGEY